MKRIFHGKKTHSFNKSCYIFDSDKTFTKIHLILESQFDYYGYQKSATITLHQPNQ